ncbi:hypothetical protein OEZ86_003380 [Tetradesmus obliquus]|nr:hypothetical protein OEZ86_003369 [Tetradesmus obliquus]WIA32565.1 hypothetical protein OEZ86_003372 [Tetradesmus obliquus]WIA32569.1 hypothetical protein OEZ86_003376 [Tetradesmus obliquus]WIA32573.1 hypothetical protein OEZ86_003380 [Tetradesmus obliquus]
MGSTVTDAPQVTDSPQVHSNGFHVCFDLAADATLGYILPTWLEPADRTAADATLGYILPTWLEPSDCAAAGELCGMVWSSSYLHELSGPS